ncbi:MAG: protein kinase [Acidobacteria bacterium]|nr:protein kinase [Acidobacteriota bacterium]
MIGRTLLHYEIVEKLGEGGMGVVWKARDPRLQRFVAVKVLPADRAADPARRARFLREARAAAALNHPHIVTVHDIARDGDTDFIVMELVGGQPLSRAIPAGGLPVAEALRIGIEVADALAAAHVAGVVHRDLKPANVLLSEDGRAKVLDFGLATLASEEEGGERLTRDGAVVGTIAYMSPEQAQGEDLDPRTDLWSLGVVLYEMLTGELPFKGDRDLSIIHSIIYGEPKPIRQRKPPVPPELQQVVARALKKKREARYGSVADMLKDLKTFEETRRAEASGVFDLRSLLKRLRRPAVAVPTVLAVAAVAALTVWFFDRQAKIRWAREVILPEAERLIEGNFVKYEEPFKLAETAERIIPNDKRLSEIFAMCSLRINVKTEPQGARVFMKDYRAPANDWIDLGVTPVENFRVPIGFFRWKIEKEGYETVLAASTSWDIVLTPRDRFVPADLVRVLDKKGSIPEGMVRVAGAETPLGKLEDFFIDRHEVTNRQYMEFVNKGGYRNRSCWKHKFVRDGKTLNWEEAMAEFVDRTARPGPSTWEGGTYPDGQADYPVSGVSWYEAAAYAEFAGKSLPTGHHWGVARGEFTPMIGVPQAGGDALFAPFSNFQGKGPVPVGSLEGITPFGAFDMAGNVREWCSNETPQGRLIRGGAWNDNTYMSGQLSNAPAWDRSPQNGFRCALYPDPGKVPAAAFEKIDFGKAMDVSAEKPVPDAVFDVYRVQFSYDKTDLEPRLESRDESSTDWIKERVTFNAAYGGERLIGMLYLPKNAEPPYQTVIYFPGSQAVFRSSSAELENDMEFQTFLSFIVKSGRAALYPVYKGTMERASAELIPTAMGANNATHRFTEYMIQVIKDFKRCVDYLETRQDIDSGRLAFYGMSWGAWMGAYIPAVEERLKASVLLGGGFDIVNPRPRPEVNETNYLPRVKIPTLMLNGKYDTLCNLERSIKPMFDLLGTRREHKALKLYETDHIPPKNEFVKETLAWLDKYLGPVKR